MAALLFLGPAAVASVLAAGPASAANSAREDLDDDGTRPFAGADRYATARLIADAYVTESIENERTSVTSAVVVSGTGFADALSAAALAGDRRAPILLTRPGSLPSSVRRFVNDNDISDIYIIGGVAAVSAAVEASLEAIPSVVAVTRIQGATRYETALAVAREVGGARGIGLGTYCSTREEAVLLANGAGFADALAGGPLAYDGPLPILLTPADALPAGVLSYLAAARVARVVILGGTVAVSAAVEKQIRDTGVTVKRLAGADRFATAAVVASELTTGADDCDFSLDDYALANGRSPYDALAAGPLLGLRRHSLLLTNTTVLPAGTADFLAATPVLTRGDPVNLSLTVLGGASTVSAAVVRDAVAKATTSDAITAEIVVDAGARGFVVNFSEAVDADSAENFNAYTLDGSTLLGADDVTYYQPDEDRTNVAPHVTVVLDDFRLEPGTVIAVLGNVIKADLSVRGDERFVVGTLRTIPQDKLRPRLVVYAEPGATVVYVRASEPLFDRAGEPLTSFRVRVDYRSSSSTDETLQVRIDRGGDGVLLWSAVVGALENGDSVTVSQGEVHDVAGNQNSSTRRTVPRTSTPVLASVSVSATKHAEQAYADLERGLTIGTKSTGDFAGAKGNDWSVEVVGARATVVTVNERRKRVHIGLRDPDADAADTADVTFAELLAAADASDEFTDGFQFVDRDTLTATDLRRRITARYASYPMDGGESTAVVRARWSQLLVDADDSRIGVCERGTCRDRNNDYDYGIVPSTWVPTDASAHNAITDVVEWEVIDDEDGTTIPTSAWSLRFEDRAVEGLGDDPDNIAVVRRLRAG